MNKTFTIEGGTLLHKILYQQVKNSKFQYYFKCLGIDKADSWINTEKQTAVTRFYY